ncbi:MAG: hypothetical protein VW437_01085 [Betaproteobacteria bacterium]
MNKSYRKICAIIVAATGLASTTIGVAFDYENLFTQNAQHCAETLDSEKQNILERLFSDKVSARCLQYASKTTRDQLDQFFLDKKLTDHEYRRLIHLITEKEINAGVVSGTSPPIELSTVQTATIVKPQEKSIEPLSTAPGFKTIGAQSKEKK